MQLDAYLMQAGFTEAAATAIANTYAHMSEEDFVGWLVQQGLPAKPIVGMIAEWAQQESKQTAGGSIVEPLAARPFCLYKVVGPNDAVGRCWAAMRVPIHYPGAMDQGGRPSQYAVVAAEQDPDTKLYKWVTLTPNAKIAFGYALEQSNIQNEKWAIVREYDLMRGEKVDDGQNITM